MYLTQVECQLVLFLLSYCCNSPFVYIVVSSPIASPVIVTHSFLQDSPKVNAELMIFGIPLVITHFSIVIS